MNKGIYLPEHRKEYNSAQYMKNLISTKNSYLLIKDINWVTVTTYDELTPWNVIE